MRKPDPTNLISSSSPALVAVDGQGAVFVADASTKSNGWLRVREWNGTSTKLPPHRVQQVRYLETEYHGDRRDDGSKPKRLADSEWRETAREWVEEEEEEEEGQPDDAEHRVIA